MLEYLTTRAAALAPAAIWRARSRTSTRPPRDAELGWRASALVQRLHALDHRTQVKALRATLGH